MKKFCRNSTCLMLCLGVASLLVSHVTRGTHFHRHGNQYSAHSAVTVTGSSQELESVTIVASIPQCFCTEHDESDRHSDSDKSEENDHPCSICLLLKNNIGQAFSFLVDFESSNVDSCHTYAVSIKAFLFKEQPRGRSPPTC